MLRNALFLTLSLLACVSHAGDPQVLSSPSSPQKADYVEISPGQYAPTASLALHPTASPTLRYADGSEKPIHVSESLKLESAPKWAASVAISAAILPHKRFTKEEVGIGAYMQALHISRAIEKSRECETLRVHDTF